MPKPTTGLRHDRAQTFSIANQKAYAREAVLAADPETDYSPYDARLHHAPAQRDPDRVLAGAEPLHRQDRGRQPRSSRTAPRSARTCSRWGPKIINHETGHAISLPESYNGSGTGATHLWVGGWDLMGNILGHAPEYMAWNKWKLGWLDDPDFGCLASDGSAEYTLSPVSTPSDGTTKKGVVIRTGADDRGRGRAASAARQRRDRDGHARARTACATGAFCSTRSTSRS